jgi:hypothetical protein
MTTFNPDPNHFYSIATETDDLGVFKGDVVLERAKYWRDQYAGKVTVRDPVTDKVVKTFRARQRVLPFNQQHRD